MSSFLTSLCLKVPDNRCRVRLLYTYFFEPRPEDDQEVLNFRSW